VQLYNPKTRERKAITIKDLEKDAKDVLDGWELLVFKRDPKSTSEELPFYLKRRGDFWIVQKGPESPW